MSEGQTGEQIQEEQDRPTNLDLLANILLLLSLKSELDEDLLQLFVDVVDA